jgi:hypothetical protein
MAEMELLPKMTGERITTGFEKPPDVARYPSRDWIVIEKLSESPKPITPEDFADGMGPAFTSGKYLCRLAGSGNEHKLGFMRIYKQIPLDGTRLDNSSVRKAQACKPRNHVELEALKHLTERRCPVTPRLLGYRTDKQDEHDIVPGGYILYLVWEKVRGDSLDIKWFWSLPYNQREKFRKKFQEAYMFVTKHIEYDRVPRANSNQGSFEVRLRAVFVDSVKDHLRQGHRHCVCPTRSLAIPS